MPAHVPAQASNTQDLSGISLDFDTTIAGSQPDGGSGPDFGLNMAQGDSINFLEVGPGDLNAKVTYLSDNGVDSMDVLDFNDSGSGDNRMLNVNISFDAAGSPAADRYGEFEIEFYRVIAQTYTPVTVSNLQISAYDIDNRQFFTIDKAASYELSEYTVINHSRVDQSRWEFFSANLSTSTTSSPGPTTRSAFSQGRVTVTMNSASKYTVRLGVSKLESGTSGATFILDFGPGKLWGTRAGLDAPQVIQASSAPVMSDAVSFNPNGGTGTMSQQRATTTTNLTANTFTRSGFSFSGWNTSRDGSGTPYANSAAFTFTAGTNVTELFAQWVAVQNSPNATFGVTFDANGGSGTMETQTASAATSLRANAFARPGHVFNGWNTQANGSGTAYADGASFPFSANTTLYAQWILPAPYSGPIPIQIIEKTIPEQTESLVTLAGERLNQITAATVLGKTVQVTPVDASNIRLLFPALPVGVYDVTYTYRGGGILTHQRGLTVVPGKVVKDPEVFTISKRFTNYRGDRGPVVARDQRAIAAFIKENPGLTSINCEGSTSGVPAIRTDAALATARAQNACRIVARLVPGIKTTISISTGQGIGQYYRAVTLSGEGVRQN